MSEISFTIMAAAVMLCVAILGSSIAICSVIQQYIDKVVNLLEEAAKHDG